MTDIELADRRAYRARRRTTAIVDGATPIAAVAFALVLAAAVIAATGRSPLTAITALVTGPLDRPNRIGQWMQETTTLTLLGLSAAIPFRARQISIGAEGQLYLGALAGFLTAMWFPMPAVIAPIVCTVVAALAGAVAGWIPGVMKSRLDANEIVATLMLNVIIVQVFDYLLNNRFRTGGAVASQAVPANTRWIRLDQIIDQPYGQANIGIVVALAAVVAFGLLTTRTGLGYRMKVVGSNPNFARYGGIKVAATIDWSFVLGGALAGIAGAHILFGVYQRLEPGMAGGFGFLGVVVALLGRNHPIGIPVAAAFYALLRVGGDAMERETAVGSEIVLIIQAVIVILVTARLLATVARRTGERHVGRTHPATPDGVQLREVT